MKIKKNCWLYGGCLLFLVSMLFVGVGRAYAATYAVPAQGQLSSVCEQATAFGDVINVAAGTLYDNGRCNLRPGVKIIGAGKGVTVIHSSTDPYISAESGLPTSNGSNEISGVSFVGNGGNTIISSIARDNQKIHDIAVSSARGGIYIQGKFPSGINCYGNVPSESSTFCFDDTKFSHQPADGDWVDGLELYGNTLTDANLKMHTIRGAKVHNNTIDNRNSGISGVGWTSFWWDSVDFYENTIHMDQISWTHIGMEVWMIQNDTKFRNNWTDGWFSLLDNPLGPKTPYSWEITGNTFSSNAIRGDVREALETSYSVDNVLVANNLFENTGSNKTYGLGIAIWGTGNVSNVTIRNNIFRNLDGDGIEINTGDNTSGVIFEGQNFNIYNNVFDNLGGASGIYISDGRGTLNGVNVRNNVFRNLNYGILVYPGGHDVRNIVVTNNDGVGINGMTNDNGSGAFSNVSNNFSLDPGFGSDYQLQGTSQLIDKGANVGLPYSGNAPDIGAYEYGSGSIVTPPPVTPPEEPTCTQLTFSGGSASPATATAGQTYQISCNYGIENIDSVKAANDLGECEWVSWSGTSALFSCASGMQGTRTNTCSIISGTSSNSCASSNTINSVVVGSLVVRYSIDDVVGVFQNWKKTIANVPSDVNRDGIINIRDLGTMLSNWQ